jgi:hypothetical protein
MRFLVLVQVNKGIKIRLWIRKIMIVVLGQVILN